MPAPRDVRRLGPAHPGALWRRALRTWLLVPIGLQQLRRQRTSALLALAGLVASIVVIFVQLGIERAVYHSATRLHRHVRGDLILVPAGFQSIQRYAHVPQVATDIVTGHAGVAATRPLRFGVIGVKHASMANFRRIAWYGIDVENPAIDAPGLAANLHRLRMPRSILFDDMSRPLYGALPALLASQSEVTVLGPPDDRRIHRQMFAVGTFSVGPNAFIDGAILIGEASLAESLGWISDAAFVALDVAPGSTLATVRSELQAQLGPRGEILFRDEFIARELWFWSRETPIGYLTDLGFVLGIMIGMVFIYYAQYQFIRANLSEYALLQCLGYGKWFFFGVVMQVTLAIAVPAFLIAMALAVLILLFGEHSLALGLAMGPREITFASAATLLMIVISGLFALRRLWRIDPIMLFD